MFRKALAKNLTPSQIHGKELVFMAENSLWQIGQPRIGLFADRQRPEPVHNEINTWPLAFAQFDVPGGTEKG